MKKDIFYLLDEFENVLLWETIDLFPNKFVD